jgi:Domain of unknown function (DUF1918)
VGSLTGRWVADGEWLPTNSTPEVTMEAHVGDRIIVESRKVGDTKRTGEIIEVLTNGGGAHYRIRWDTGHETIMYPSTDAVIQHSGSSG